MNINLCSGYSKIPGFTNVDMLNSADIVLDLEKDLLPFEDNSVDSLICISAINYFTVERAQEILNEVFRVLKPNGIFRIATQDLNKLVNYFSTKDESFFYQRLENGNTRFPGNTMAEKFNEWFNGFTIGEKSGKFVYDFQTLKIMLHKAGFNQVEEKQFQESSLANIELIDNRPEQMFFVEMKKEIYTTMQKKSLSNEEHMKLAIDWLEKAYNVTSDDGVSAYYNYSTKKWHTSYPETTGYIIPTILNYYKLTNKPHYLQIAINMGDWLIKIQEEDGGVAEPLDANYESPRKFNTAQIIFGWVALYQETQEKRFLNAALLSGEWILNLQEEDGSFIRNTYMGQRAYNTRSTWALALLYKETKDERYKHATEKFMQWIETLVTDDNNWINMMTMNPDKNNNATWSHPLIYTLRGIFEINEYEIGLSLQNVLTNMLDNLVEMYNNPPVENKNIIGMPHVIRKNYKSVVGSSANTSSAQLAILLFKASKKFNNDAYLECANNLVKDLNSLQYINESDANLNGSLPGCTPNISASYCHNLIPNWGVKFYIDALMLQDGHMIQTY